MVKPYHDESIIPSKFLRTFQENVDIDDLVWHQDHHDRTITILSGSNWKLQYDNSMPILLELGKKYYIPKNEYHRLIRGNGNLLIQIDENDVA